MRRSGFRRSKIKAKTRTWRPPEKLAWARSWSTRRRGPAMAATRSEKRERARCDAETDNGYEEDGMMTEEVVGSAIGNGRCGRGVGENEEKERKINEGVANKPRDYPNIGCHGQRGDEAMACHDGANEIGGAACGDRGQVRMRR